MKAMAKRSAILLVAAVMIALASFGPRHATPTAAARSAASPLAPVLYQADWTTGVGGWTLYRGFNVSQGMLTFDGMSDSGAFAPFSLKGLTSYAVEATIKVGTSATPEQASYEIFARRASARHVTGLFAGYASIAGEKAATNVAALYWDGSSETYATYVPGAAFRPDAGFHIYRLEVQGSLYRLLIDGQEMVPWTLVTTQNLGDMAGLVFTYIPAEVKTFTVLELPAAPVTTTLDTSALLRHVIPSRDIAFPADNAVIRDNERYALDNNLDLATVRGTGRVLGYYQGFENATTYVEQSVNLHQSAAGARAVFDLFSGRIRHDANQFQGYHEVDLSGQKIGDESFAFGYHYLGYRPGGPSYVLRVLFHRGKYYVGITVDSASQNMPRTAIAYARLADKLIQ